MSRDSSRNHRPPRSAKLRRRLGVGGLSLVTTTGLFGTYLGYPGLRRAYAAPAPTCEVTTHYDSATLEPGELRYCLDQVDTPGGGTITIRPDIGTIYLNDDLPTVTAVGTFTITGAGQGNSRIDGQNLSSAFRFSGLASTVYVSDLTIGNTYDETYYAPAVDVVGDLTLSAFSAEGNESSNDGGAVRVGSNAVIRDSTFTNNEAARYGGALYIAGFAAVYDSDFDSNEAGEDGGAIAGYYTTTITGSSFTSNSALDDGGAVYVRSGNVNVTNSSFDSNDADYDSDGYGAGGAIWTSYGVDISDSVLNRNSAYDAGAIYSRSNASITRSTFSYNTASGFGGAISGAPYPAPLALLTVTNSTFTANDAQGCAAINWYGNAQVNFVTITANTSTGANPNFPAIYVDGDVSLSNSITFGNINVSGSSVDLDVRGVLTASNSLLSSSSSFTALNGQTISGVIYGDPKLGQLANNGGPVVANTGSPTLTMLPAADSPIIGMADPTGAPAFDQRGYTRTTNGLADMGSVERGGSRPAPDLSQMPPAWFQATTRNEQTDQCPTNMHPSWAEWPNNNTGGWTCEWSTWWDVNKGVQGGWVTTPGFNPGRPVSE